jgi:DNA-3-methyladenine glycosylase II
MSINPQYENAECQVSDMSAPRSHVLRRQLKNQAPRRAPRQAIHYTADNTYYDSQVHANNKNVETDGTSSQPHFYFNPNLMTSDCAIHQNNPELVQTYNMFVRRSARLASTTMTPPLDTKVQNGGAKYEKVGKASGPAKKRKPVAAPAPTSPDATNGESNGTGNSDPANSAPSNPATPLPKKRKAASKSTSKVKSPLKPPPLTPTPAGASIFSSAPFLSPSDSSTRPAAPHTTNASLATPNGSQVVQAYASPPAKPTDLSPAKKRKAKETLPPDVGAIPPASTDIDSILKEAEEFLIRTDPKLERVVTGHKCEIFSPEGLREVVRPFESLGKGIIGQQVSGQAAASIRAKFTALFPDTHPSFPSPAQVLTKDIPTLRTAGLSQRKAEYIYGIAEKFCSGELSAEMLVSASDEELIEKLVAVRGLGRWSVEMFACFGLKRMDVFSTGDLGVQ